MTDQPLSGASVPTTDAMPSTTPAASATSASPTNMMTVSSGPVAPQPDPTTDPRPFAAASTSSARHEPTRTESTPSDGPAFGHEFFHPRSAVWWLFCAALVVATPGIAMDMASPLRGAQGSLWTIAPLFVGTFAIFVWLALRADPYRARRRWILMLALAYGATVPTWLGVHANGHLSALSAKLLPTGDGADWSSAIAGPTSEEWGKMLGVVLIMLVASRTLRRPMHGLLVGSFVGLGFQIFENVTYAAHGAFSDANSDLRGALGVTVLRSVIGVSSHWLYTGISGVGVAFLLGRTVHRRSLGARIGVFLGLYLVAWGLHFFWNSPAAGVRAGVLLPVKMVLGVVAFLLVARAAWKQERVFLAEADAAVHRDGLVGSVPDGVRSAIGPRKQRRRQLRAVRRAVRAETGSRKDARRAKKATKKARRRYLDTLQAWGRRGTGVDELFGPPEHEEWAAASQPHAATPVLRQCELAANPFAPPLEPAVPFTSPVESDVPATPVQQEGEPQSVEPTPRPRGRHLRPGASGSSTPEER